jgi:hypothetical protein
MSHQQVYQQLRDSFLERELQLCTMKVCFAEVASYPV